MFSLYANHSDPPSSIRKVSQFTHTAHQIPHAEGAYYPTQLMVSVPEAPVVTTGEFVVSLTMRPLSCKFDYNLALCPATVHLMTTSPTYSHSFLTTYDKHPSTLELSDLIDPTLSLFQQAALQLR